MKVMDPDPEIPGSSRFLSPLLLSLFHCLSHTAPAYNTAALSETCCIIINVSGEDDGSSHGEPGGAVSILQVVMTI